MKKTRLAALVILAAVCIAGWAVLGRNILRETQEQQSIVEAAQYYRSKKLFQLSLINYQSALASKPTEALYDEYLDACAEYYEGNPTPNVRDTESQAYAAAVAEYPERGDYWERYAALYYEDGDYDALVEVLKDADSAGIPFNDQMIRYWNEAYYACEIYGTSYESVAPAGMDGVYLSRDGERTILFDSLNGTLLEKDYVFVGPVGQETAVLCSNEEGESFVFQLSNGLMVGRFMAQIQQANGYGEGLIPVKQKGRSDWCYIDIDGKEYLRGYQAAGMFQNGKAPVQKDGVWFFVDQSGMQQGDSYEEIQLTENGSWQLNGVYLAKKNGRWNFYTETGEQKGTLDADQVDLNRGTGLAFAKDGKWGFADNEGTVVLEPEYEAARSFSGGVAAVCRDGRWGFINGSGTLVVDYLLDEAGYFDSNGKCLAKLDDGNGQQMLSWRVERS